MSSPKSVLKALLPYSAYSRIRDTARYVSSFRYVGNRFECPFCGGRFAAFVPSGMKAPILKQKQVVSGGYRENSLCPRCYSADRERMIYLFFKSDRPDVFSRTMRVLHVAPEKNLASVLKASPNISYVSSDLSSPEAMVKMDITAIPEPDQSYDMVICNHVLEHIPDDGLAMRELYRVLKPGGFAILQVPISYALESTFEDPSVTSPEDRYRVFGQKDHVRIYGRDYTRRLERAGFTVNELPYAASLPASEADRFALLKEERLYFCLKA